MLLAVGTCIIVRSQKLRFRATNGSAPLLRIAGSKDEHRHGSRKFLNLGLVPASKSHHHQRYLECAELPPCSACDRNVGGVTYLGRFSAIKNPRPSGGIRSAVEISVTTFIITAI